MFCKKCGTKNEPNTKFCVNCGTNLKEIIKSNNSKDYLQLLFDSIKTRAYLIYIPLIVLILLYFIDITMLYQDSYGKDLFGFYTEAVNNEVRQNLIYLLWELLKIIPGIFFDLLSRFDIKNLLLFIFFIGGFLYICFGYIGLYFSKYLKTFNKNNFLVLDSISAITSIFAFILLYTFKSFLSSFLDYVTIGYTLTPLNIILIGFFSIAVLSIYNILKSLKIIKGFNF